MKKLILLILSLLLFTGCGADTAPTEVPTEPPTEDPYAPIGDENTFLLPALPDIGEYQADEVKRWQDGPMPELIPSDKYGKLHPYLGDVKKYSTYSVLSNSVETVDRRYYGLCTADGTLVTDPVYTSISHHDGCYLLITEYADETSEIYSRAYIAAEDGSNLTLIHDGVGIPRYYAPDVYGVIDGDFVGAYPIPYHYMHADGTHYDTDLSGIIEYENGTILFREQTRHGLSDSYKILDKELRPIGGYIYQRQGAPGQSICKRDKTFVILDEDLRELYSTEFAVFYDGGRYIIKTADDTLTFLDEGFAVIETVTYPAKIHGVNCGYVFCYENGQNLYYTFSGEKSDYTLVKQCTMSGAYLLQGDGGTLIKDGEEEYFFEGKQVKYGGIYGDAVAVMLEEDYNCYLYDREDGSLISQLSRFDEVGYRLYGEEDYSYVRPESGRCAYRAHNGVYTTFDPDGKVLVKIHLDND